MAAQSPIPVPRVTVTEEIIYPRGVTLEELLRLVFEEKRTGSITINFHEGTKIDLVWKHKRK
jgi:hypothetical protein